MTKATNLEVAWTTGDYELRAETILHLGAMCISMSPSHALETALDEDLPEIQEALEVSSFPYGESVHEVVDFLIEEEIAGFLVRMATPVPKDIEPSGSYGYNWGHFTSKWFYGEDIADIYRQAEKWRVEYLRGKGVPHALEW